MLVGAFVVIFVVAILAFIGFCIYGMIKQRSVRKKGSNSKLWTIIGFLVVFLAFVLILVYTVFSGEAQTEQFKTVFGYVISIVFLGIGIYGIRKKIALKHTRKNMLVVEGTQVDYYLVKGVDIGDKTYYPIYEYELNGEFLRYQSHFGSNSKKYRTLGRKVHILINPKTRKVECEEDEHSTSSMYLVFGVFGILVLCILLAGTFGIL